ncbi:MAG: hypothetical protein Q9204_007220, partial [Flavoplaca sp. TL-2023a]
MAIEVPPLSTHKILFIDAYDSFSNNIVSLLEERLEAVNVTVIKIDQSIQDFPAFLRGFDAVVAGPGPGHPGNAVDVGLIAELWRLHDEYLLPVLGICLGFQSLLLAFGGSVVPLANPRHGIVRQVTSINTSIFKGLGPIAPVQYHSLHAVSGHQDGFELLAWDVEADNHDLGEAADNGNPDAILMAAKHRTKPFWGLQFHPESICSDQASQQLIDNWWVEARVWNSHRRAFRRNDACIRRGLEIASNMMDPHLDLANPEDLSLHRNSPPTNCGDLLCPSTTADADPKTHPVTRRTLSLDERNVLQICTLLQMEGEDAVVFDSEPHQRADTGEHSIIGCLGRTTVRLEYYINTGKVCQIQGTQWTFVNLNSYGGTIFGYLKSFMNARRAAGGDLRIPFWGGLVGYINYEACLETIDIRTPGHANKPDASFVFVERSVVIDHQHQQLHVQSIIPEDEEWVEMISSWLTAKIEAKAYRFTPIDPCVLHPVITHPDASSYANKIGKCQDYIRRGDAYELCLTNQATVDTSHLRNPWPLYLHLRLVNAAPFSAYMRIGGMTLLSSSPERFMRWTRPTLSTTSAAEVSTVQVRPIKGTVKR